jgi:hypothetical protein
MVEVAVVVYFRTSSRDLSGGDELSNVNLIESLGSEAMLPSCVGDIPVSSMVRDFRDFHPFFVLL